MAPMAPAGAPKGFAIAGIAGSVLAIIGTFMAWFSLNVSVTGFGSASGSLKGFDLGRGKFVVVLALAGGIVLYVLSLVQQ